MNKFYEKFSLVELKTTKDELTGHFVSNLMKDNDNSRLALSIILQIAIDADTTFDFDDSKGLACDENVENLTLFIDSYIDVDVFNSSFVSTVATMSKLETAQLKNLFKMYKAGIKESSND